VNRRLGLDLDHDNKVIGLGFGLGLEIVFGQNVNFNVKFNKFHLLQTVWDTKLLTENVLRSSNFTPVERLFSHSGLFIGPHPATQSDLILWLTSSWLNATNTVYHNSQFDCVTCRLQFEV